MKASIGRDRERREKAKQQMTEWSKELVLKEYESFCRGYDISTLYVLLWEFDFTPEQLKHFYKTWMINYIQMKKQWKTGENNSHIDIMEARLQGYGVRYEEFEQIQREVDEENP